MSDYTDSVSIDGGYDPYAGGDIGGSYADAGTAVPQYAPPSMAALQPNIMQPGAGMPQAGVGGGGGMGLQNWLQLATILGGLGAGGAAAFGSPGRSQPVLSPAQKAALNASQSNQQQQAAAAQQQLAQTGPMFQQGAGILQGLAGGQLPPGLLDLITKSYQPEIGQVISQGIENARGRGFYDATANTGPAGALIGPAIANMPGNIIGEALKYSQGLAGNLMNPYGQAVNQLQGAGGAANAGGSMFPTGQTNQPGVGQQIMTGANVASGFGGLASLLGGPQGLQGLFGNQGGGQQQPQQNQASFGGQGGLSNPYQQGPLGVGGQYS